MKSHMEQDTPLVSIIMPVYNEAGFIGRTLASIFAQDYPHDRLEVLVADGGSKDGTREIIAETLEEPWDIPAVVIGNPARIVPTGLNALLAQARGEIIIRIDGHCEITPGFVRENVAILAEHPEAWSVGGPIVHEGCSPQGKAIALAMSHPLGVGNAYHRMAGYEGYGEGAQFPAFRRWVFDRVGTFDERLVRNQDDEFNYRLNQAGGRVFISPRVKYRYYVRERLSQLFRQYFQYAFWRIPVIKKHQKPTTLRQIVPPLFFLAVAVFFLYGAWGQDWGLALALPLIYGGILAVSTITLIPKAGWAVSLRVPPAIVVMHLAYALGLYYGLWACLFKPQAWDPQGSLTAISR
jgi:glycosyltransferase involved in cell wall biosynthesis